MIPAHDKPARDLLDFYLEAGVDALVGEQPVDRFAPEVSAPPARAPQPVLLPPDLETKGRASPLAAPQAPDEAAMAAREAAKSAKTLDELRAILEKFDGCALKATATQLVFADGNPQARVMFVGEAPGRDEDIEGLPFVGRSGKLLDRMLAAIGLDRSSVYIANIVPWRPPGNRTPTPQESAICLPFIRRQIELADPDILVCLGGPSAQTLLGIKEGITKTRGRWYTFDTGKREIRAMPTFHPGVPVAQPAAEAFRLARFSGDQESAGGQLAIGNQNRARRDQRDAEPVRRGEPLAEKDHAEDRHQHNREFVDRRDFGRLAELERAKVTQPRCAGAEPRQHQEQIGARGNLVRRLELPGHRQQKAERDDDHDGADESREIGVDVLDADFGKDGGERREQRREHRPALPGRERVHPETANLIANSTASTSTAGEASLTLPEISLTSA